MDALTCGEDAPSAATPAEDAAGRRSDFDLRGLLQAVELALREQQPLPDLPRSLCADDWHTAFATTKVDGELPFTALSAEQLRRLVVAAESEVLCDLLLRHVFPRLLLAESDSSIDDGEATLPLPPPLTDLLLLLLRRGSALNMATAEFQREVVGRLHSIRGLGGRAAVQAALIFASILHSEGETSVRVTHE